jgi:hypothetical protein
MARIAALLAAVALALPAPARADDERALVSIDDVHDACRASRRDPAGELLVITVDPGWTFGELDSEGFLVIEARRTLRALAGRVDLIPSHLERVGLVATPERADQLEAARAAGALLRLGFFLGMDEPDRSACLVRSRFGVTTVRMDVAYVELVGADGGTIARDDGDRLRAWRDDHERDAIPGSGPRAAIEAPTAGAGTAPDAWARAITNASSGEVGQALATCHRDGVARGAETRGRVLVRLRVDGRSGNVLESALALSDLGDTEEAECIAGALRRVSLPPGPGDWGGRVVDLSVPVRLAAD